MYGTMLGRVSMSKPSAFVGVTFDDVQPSNVVDNKSNNNNKKKPVTDPMKQMKVVQSLLEDIEDIALKDPTLYAHAISNLRAFKRRLLGLKVKSNVDTLHPLLQSSLM